ncbi:Hypothetical predicted protein [Pelobates cultripes]|uniref:Uncharacterized protein n=1 Tax=Pelobates cultripes TaxID=61616 RepID=A0AAD1SY71_PELCU|nr:Hypothetical predicted protein [Pelobates cultripes]
MGNYAIHYYTTKEAILKYNRDHELTYQGTTIALYQDLFTGTLQRRRDRKPMADVLRHNGIQFTWGHPFKIVAFKVGRRYTYLPGNNLMKFLDKLSITPPTAFTLPGPTRTAPGTPERVV